MPDTPSDRHDPEIEFLGTMARRFLRVLRVAMWIAGVVGIVYGIVSTFSAGKPIDYVTYPDDTAPDPMARETFSSALGIVWICAGLPLLVRVDWLFGRGRWIALAVGCVFWFGASLLPDDPDYSYILRFFASLVACMVLVVWRTLWRLTKHGAGAG